MAGQGADLAHEGHVGAAVPRVVSDAAALAFHCAVQAHLERGPLPDSQWRRALRLLCEEARRRSIPVERLVVALKQALDAQPHVYRAPFEERAAITGRLVSLCIEEYFDRAATGTERPVALAQEIDAPAKPAVSETGQRTSAARPDAARATGGAISRAAESARSFARRIACAETQRQAPASGRASHRAADRSDTDGQRGCWA